MDCIVLAGFILRGKGMIEPSSDPAAPRSVELTREQYERFRALGCVRLKEEHETLVQAQSEAANFVEEAALAAMQQGERLLEEARAAQPEEPKGPKRQRRRT